MTPDVNVLVAVARSDHPHHGIALAWLKATFAEADSGVVCTLMPMVLASFLRLVTSPRIFQRPTPIEEAIGFVDALLLLPGVQLAELGDEWKRFRQLCLDKTSVQMTFRMPGSPLLWRNAGSISSASIETSGNCWAEPGSRFSHPGLRSEARSLGKCVST